MGNCVSKKSNLSICPWEVFRDGLFYKKVLIIRRTEVEEKNNLTSQSKLRIFSDIDLLE